MTFELKMTDQEAFDGLKASFGTEFVAADVRAFCRINDIAYATVTKKIKQRQLRLSKNLLVLLLWNHLHNKT